MKAQTILSYKSTNIDLNHSKEDQMEIRYDKQAKAISMRIAEGEVHSTNEIQDDLIVDKDINGKIIKVEILGVDDVDLIKR